MAPVADSSRCWMVIITVYLLQGIVQANNPPVVVFGSSSGHQFQFEDAPLGTVLFTITARDFDSDDLTFKTVGEETQKLVNLTNKSGSKPTWTIQVVLAARLDRDREPASRLLQFNVTDLENWVPGRVTLTIRDVNDNPPVFENLPYRLEIHEGAEHVNQSVFLVPATDVDDGQSAVPLYYMTAKGQGADYDYNTTFVIRDRAYGNVTLQRELDYETQTYYEYVVTSQDNGQPPCPGPSCKCNNFTEPNVKCEGIPAIFTVSVLDVQDTPPLFLKLPYYTSVYENASLGSSVFQVSAMDGDRGIPNDIMYNVTTVGQYNFTVGPETGTIYLASYLDADDPSGRNINLEVMAFELNKPGVEQKGETNTTATVSITVLDVNDNSPLFDETSYIFTVQENTPNGVPLTPNSTDFIEVTDKDQGDNSQFSLSLETEIGTVYTVFDTLPRVGIVIQGTTTVTLRVQNSSVLDYEKIQNITFKLVAKETSTAEKFSNFTTITVFLEDVNDNSPVFLNDTPTNINVTEHSPNGTALAQFNATDQDSGDFGKVSYSLEGADNLFRIDQDTGVLMVKSDIDREGGETSFTLVVVATDNMAGDENNRRFARWRVKVQVLDINDNAPIFDSHSQNVRVQENVDVGTVVVTLTARDKDQGENANVTYSILSVEVNSTSPDVRTSPDSSRRLEFFAINTTRDNTATSATGTLYINSSLVDFSGTYNVTVQAEDGGQPPLNSTTLVMVKVDDVNLNTPVFVTPNESNYNSSIPDTIPFVKINETKDRGLLVMSVSATDKDKGQNGQVSYSIDPDPNKAWLFFHIDIYSGNLTNADELDYEKTKDFTISLKASDHGWPVTLFKVLPLRVELLDIDDNDPYFSPQTLTLQVEEEKAGAYVGNVSVARDADTLPENRIMCYYLYGGEDAASFHLFTNGSLYTAVKLDREVKAEQKLVVKVLSNCFLPHDYYIKGTNNTFNSSDNSLLSVTVMVLDINDNPPVFETTDLSVGVLYDQENGTVIFNLSSYVTDKDEGSNAHNMFRLLRIDTEGTIPDEVLHPAPFAVLQQGLVITMKLFSSDTVGIFVLVVNAYDSVGQNATASLKVYLVSNYQRVKIVVGFRVNDMELRKQEFIKELSTALNMNVVVDKITTHTDSSAQQDPNRADVYIHARYRTTGEIVPAYELWRAFDYYPAVKTVFVDFKVIETLPVQEESKAAEEGDNLQRPFIIVAVALSIVCIVLILVLINTVRRYRRRLKAATTPAYVTSKQEPDVFVAPGTNRYYAAENPLYGQDVKVIDPDRLSNGRDSLDDNEVDSDKEGDEKEPEEEQEIYLELNDDGRSPAHVNHLAMVIEQYEQQNNAKNARDVNSATPSRSDKRNNTIDSGFIEHGALDAYMHTDI